MAALVWLALLCIHCHSMCVVIAVTAPTHGHSTTPFITMCDVRCAMCVCCILAYAFVCVCGMSCIFIWKKKKKTATLDYKQSIYYKVILLSPIFFSFCVSFLCNVLVYYNLVALLLDMCIVLYGICINIRT